IRAGLPSRVDIHRDASGKLFTGTTENVRRFRINPELARPATEFSVALDGEPPVAMIEPYINDVCLVLAGDRWVCTQRPDASFKGPPRFGPFRQAFQRRMQFVYGTRGTPEENAWAAARARFDAETFWYRGNGSVDVLPDTAFDPAAEP